MKLCFFSNANSSHTAKWAKWFAENGSEVHIISLEDLRTNEYEGYESIHIHWLGCRAKRLGGFMQKARYLTTVKKARSLVSDIKPDIVHAHYATSYGLVCAISCKQPYFLSVWGSDIYDFPAISVFHRGLLSYSLKKCAWLLSTSEAMAKEAANYTDKQIEVTPFGVDLSLFHPAAENEIETTPEKKNSFTVGLVKSLEEKYGIEYLLQAIALVGDKRPDISIQARIAGAGTQAARYKELAKQYEIENRITWLGQITQEQAAEEWRMLNVAVIPSVQESFGVAAVEAQACGTPLIVSDAPGLVECCGNGKCAIVVPRRDAESIANALINLFDHPELASRLSKLGIHNVSTRYELDKCFSRVQKMYESAIDAKNKKIEANI